jgi:hypothetical protein
VAIAFNEDGRLFVAEMGSYANDGVGIGAENKQLFAAGHAV